MTNHWVDIKHADVILIMGGNAAEAHPCGFKWVTEAMEHRKAKLVVVDPRFTRSAAVADYYVRKYTNASFIIKDSFAFDNGIFSGYDAEKRRYDRSKWGYEIGADGYAVVDETLQHPRCAFQLLKTHFSRYTPEMVEKICGTPKDQFLKVAEMIGSTSTPDRVMTIMYALGWTQHSVGSENIRTMAMIQLLLGNIGRAGGGVNALRGHANVQGITDMNAVQGVLPGYLRMPTDSEQDFQKYLEARALKPLRPNQMSYWQNFPNFFVSLQKALWGNAATKENNFAYDWMPKGDKAYDVLAIFELMFQGKMNGLIANGFNPIAAVPNAKKMSAALSKLKYMVIMDPLRTETSEFWKNYGEFNNVKPEDIQTEVFRLPTSCFAEDAGTFTNSGRVLQWKWAGAEPPGSDRQPVVELHQPDQPVARRVATRDLRPRDHGRG
jgi:formate dehydrogenase major subunit